MALAPLREMGRGRRSFWRISRVTLDCSRRLSLLPQETDPESCGINLQGKDYGFLAPKP